MKHFIIASILFIAFDGYSQTFVKTQPDNNSNLDQYLWSFSKNKAASQKPLVDFNAIDNWRGLGYYLSVSDNGKYFAYTINKPTGTRYWFRRPDSLVIQAISNSWRMAFATEKQGFFSGDGKQYIFQNGGTLCFLQLGTSKKKELKDVVYSKPDGSRNWLAYQWKDKDSLAIYNLLTGKEKIFDNITSFEFDKSGHWLVRMNKEKDVTLYSLATGTERRFAEVINYTISADAKSMVIKTSNNLQYIALPNGEVKNIWTVKENKGIGNYSLDPTSRSIAFTIIDKDDAANNTVGYYNEGMDDSVIKIRQQTEGIPKDLTIADAVSFSENGKYLQFGLLSNPAAIEKPSEESAGVEVWGSKDLNLQSVQAKHLDDAARYNAIANIESGEIVFVESFNKKLSLLKGDFALVKKDYREVQGDRFWERENFTDSTWIVFLKDGSTHLLPAKSGEYIWVSPDGNWLIYFEAGKGCHYYSYNLHTGEVKNISASIADNQLRITGGSDDEEAPAAGSIAAWIDGEASVLVYDSYDIWKLDLTGKLPAINITAGLGQANNTLLRLLAANIYSNDTPEIRGDQALLLRSFNRKTKEHGFYKKENLTAGAPIKLYTGRYFINKIPGGYDPNLSNEGMMPMRAKNANIWLVQRQSARDAPNYYATTDFKNYRRLTNLQPQASYNWLTQELVSFKHLDGKVGEGILYKPENFDPAKKYPVMIAFYGQFSNNMYQFRDPSYYDQSMASGKSPAWFLNNGYLVFTPDIQVVPLKYGLSIYNVIEGAAQYLNQLSYVDQGRIGCAAHSFSSKLGAYVFTHSTSIAASTISGCASYNPLHAALSEGDGMSKLQDFEVGENWGNLWENKDAWLDLTAVLQADKAKGALLLLENKESTPIYQEQAFQFFNALRRLDKNVWLLKYDNGEHTLHDLKELKDYTVRYTQFFDHYLKYAPAPQWMTQGVPLKLKGIESRYELDPQSKCNTPNGEQCSICEAWNKQYKKTPEMFQMEIKDWELDKDIAAELERKIAERKKVLDKEGEVRTKEVLRMLNRK